MKFEEIQAKAKYAIHPLRAAGPDTSAPDDFLLTATRTSASKKLPPYYIVYFLLVDLLQFPKGCRFEKVAWSVPVDYNGEAFLIEHRKFGLGIFAADSADAENCADEVAKLINKAAKAAQPYFDWRAQEAVKSSKLNVVNRSRLLFDRFTYFDEQYQMKVDEVEARKDEVIRTPIGKNGMSYTFPAFEIRQEATWLGQSVIDSFFSWTEHVFIHIAILKGICTTGKEVSDLADSNWEKKFRSCISIGESQGKNFYDQLIEIRRQLRNFVAHGAFGKEGEAFLFHSGAGAVPVRLPHNEKTARFQFGTGVEYLDAEAIRLLRNFVGFLWSGDLAPAKIYIQDSDLPSILTMAQDGSYARAMSSTEDMEKFVRYLADEFDRYANMDF